MQPTIFIGSDHGGFELKDKIHTFLKNKNYSVEDCGCNSADSCDYPEFGKNVAQKVVATKNSRGIIICGSGVGISIAANRVKGARAVLANTAELAKLGREHNGANLLALGARTQLFDSWENIVETFLTTETDLSERHTRRREQLDT